MKKINLNGFELGVLSWVFSCLIVLALSIIGIFNIYSTIVAFLLPIVSGFIMYKKGNFGIERIRSRNFKLLVLATFIIGVSLSTTSSPTIFGGRDEGSYSNAAIMMTDDGSRSHDSKLIQNFYLIYGESKALNFPGFEYNSDGHIESQFLPGYSTWLAVFYQLFGLNGLKFANLLPFMAFILSFYLLIVEVFPLIKRSDPAECLNGNIFRKCWLRLTQAEQFAWIGSIFLMTFMPILVFYKFSLSEIFYASLLWFSAYLLVRYLKAKRFLKFKLLFAPLILMIFVRIETVAILFTLLLIMIGKDFNHLRQARYQFFFALSGVALLTVIWLEPNFFINAAKGVSEISGLNANAMPETRESTILGKILPDDWKGFYSLKIWFTYNLIPFLIMSTTFLIMFFKKVFKDRKFGNEKALIIVPFILFSPTLIYLIDANISLDHPWMLRRWIFTIIPLMFFYSVLFLFYLRQRNRMFYRLITAFVIIGNLAMFIIPSKATDNQQTNLFTFSQNQGLLEQTKELSTLFEENDLILISQKSSGSGWSLISEPMRNIFKLQAVYFFNAEDYAEIDHAEFNNIYLLASEKEEFLYENISKEKIGERVIRNTIISPSRNPGQKPFTVETATKINIYRTLQ